MSLPAPMKPYENPISSAASYANQILSGISSGTTSLPEPNVRTPGFSSRGNTQPQRTVGDRQQMIRDSASRQHQNRLMAIQKTRQASLGSPLLVRSGGGGTAAPRGGSGGGAFTGGRNGLTPAAGDALNRLNAAYRQRFGQDLSVVSGGRSRQEQEKLYAAYKAGRGNLAAKPGTSVHESGRAVDFGGPIQNARSAQHVWLQQNAGQFGWLWTGKSFAQFEPWHWEYQG